MNIFIMKRKLLMAVLMFLGLGGALSVNAQNWEGNTPESIGKSSVILYNVGSKYYINSDGIWGAQVYLKSHGQFFTMSETSGKYQLVNGDRYVGWGATGAKEHEELYTTIQNGTVASNGQVISFTFTAVDGKAHVYNISCASLDDTGSEGETVYLKSGGLNNPVVYTETLDATDEDAQWMLITEDDVNEYFKKVASQTVLNAMSTDATYLIKSPTFGCREGGLSSWKTSTGKTLNDLAPAWDSEKTYSPTDEKPANFVVGNGYYGKSLYGDDGADIVEADKGLFPTEEGKTSPDAGTKCEKVLGHLWTANIHGSGKIYQEVTVMASGWYEVACKGFTNTEDGAKIYASTTSVKKGEDVNTDAFPGEAASVLMTPEAIPSTYALAAMEFRGENKDSYRKSVMIYVELGTAKSATITLGVEGTSGWACFDDFELTYYGEDKQPYFYFNELNTDMNMLKHQTTTNKHTLYLQREIKPGQWNSLTLPVNMSAASIRQTFGQGTKISELVGVDENDNYLINFRLIDLDNSQAGLEAGKLYIIKPIGDLAKLKEGTYTFDRVDNTKNKTIEGTPIEGTTKEEIVVKNQTVLKIFNVTFTEEELTDVADNGIITMTGYPHGENLEALNFRGTYMWNTQTGIIPTGSFVLGASDGKWYHTTSPISSIKGFRTWMDTSDLSDRTVEKILFSINGVTDGSATTAIDGVEFGRHSSPNAMNVYDINGRMVRNDGTTDGLVKGIYIVNGKKVVIR